MNAAVVLGLLLAQAEPAPPEPTPAPTLAPATTPTPATPAPTPAPPPTFTPAPGPALPAPAPPSAAVAAPVTLATANTVSVFVGGAVRLSPGSADQLTPTGGFSIGGIFEHRYLRLGLPEDPALFLGLGLGFFHDHFTLGLEQPFSDNRVITQTGFALTQTAAIPFSVLTLWGALGGGLTLGYFSTPETTLKPGTTSSRQPFLCGGVGVDIPVQTGMGVRVHVNFKHTLTRPDFVTDAGSHLDLFGDLLDGGIGLFYRF